MKGKNNKEKVKTQEKQVMQMKTKCLSSSKWCPTYPWAAAPQALSP